MMISTNLKDLIHLGRPAMLIATAGVVFLSPQSSEARDIGPSFDCNGPGIDGQPLAQLICSSDALSYSDLSYVITYQAVVGLSDDQRRGALAVQAKAFVRTVIDRCQLPKTGRLGRPANPTEVACIKELFDRQRSLLLSGVFGEALEEGALAPEQALSLQRALQSRKLLPADSRIDGVFGPATRAAIKAWQRSNGLLETGFASKAMIGQLSATPGQTPSTAVQAQREAPSGDRGSSPKVASSETLKRWDEELKIVDRLVPNATGNTDLVQVLTKLANSGNGKAATVLGVMFGKGMEFGTLDDVPKDQSQSGRWFQRAATLGDPTGMAQLAAWYIAEGDGKSAAAWAAESAQAGDLSGAFVLGSLFESGVGIPKSSQSAIFWYSKAGPVAAKDLARVMDAEKTAQVAADNDRVRRQERAQQDDDARKDSRLWESYKGREKSLVERLLNYQTVADENGTARDYWAVEASDNKCVATRHWRPSGAGSMVADVLNIREFSERGFRFSENGFGDEKIKIHGGGGRPLMERLRTGWQLVFAQCPAKKSDF